MNIIAQGGNKYKITIKGKSRIIDLDGVDIVSDVDYKRITKECGELDLLFCPSLCLDKFEKTAMQYHLQYGLIDVEEYINNHK